MIALGTPRRTITPLADGAVEIIDQTELPKRLVLRRLASLDEVAEAIRTMRVRGAPLIGVTAAYGLAMALRTDPSDESLERAALLLRTTRPTAVNLAWALDVVRGAVLPLAPSERAAAAWTRATEIADEDVATCRAIAAHGAVLLCSLIQRGEVDAVVVGTDRTTRNGDVVNKIGTYLKALAAREAGVPFYVAAPSSSIDWSIADGASVEIEQRAAAELTDDPLTRVANPGFDVTPAALVTGIITERGCCAATTEGLAGLFPEHAQ